MTNVDILRRCLNAVENGDTETARACLHDKFQFVHATMDKPADADLWLRVHEALSKAIPNFAFNLTNVRENDDQILCDIAITGQQTGTLDLSVIDLPIVEATDRNISLPLEPCTITFKNDVIRRLEVEPVAGGGVVGILDQLGVKVPTVA